MSRQFKNVNFTNIKAKSEGRIRVGVCAVFGNVDEWNDRIHPGAFAKTILENIKGVRHLWNHNYSEPPIARIVELRELAKGELPDEVLAKAPDATGGLLVAREYLMTDRAEEVLQGIDAGAINEMSFAYDVIKAVETQEETGIKEMPIRYIRELYELKLMDTSDVNWGMNGATVAVGAKNLISLPLGAIVSHLQLHQAGIKAGSRNSAADATLIDSIHSIAVELGAKCSTGTDDEKYLTTPSDSKAEAVIDTSLSPDWLEMSKGALDLLEF